MAGSIRYPVHCCGVFGLRPTHDFVPFSDVGPSLHRKSFSNLAVAGPIARSIADLKLVLSVLVDQEPKAVAKERLKIAFGESSGADTLHLYHNKHEITWLVNF